MGARARARARERARAEITNSLFGKTAAKLTEMAKTAENGRFRPFSAFYLKTRPKFGRNGQILAKF